MPESWREPHEGLEVRQLSPVIGVESLRDTLDDRLRGAASIVYVE